MTTTAPRPYRLISLATATRRDLQPIRTPRNENACLTWHIGAASEYSPIVKVEVAATNQHRAEQCAAAWIARKFLRHPGAAMTIHSVELVD